MKLFLNINFLLLKKFIIYFKGIGTPSCAYHNLCAVAHYSFVDAKMLNMIHIDKIALVNSQKAVGGKPFVNALKLSHGAEFLVPCIKGQVSVVAFNIDYIGDIKSISFILPPKGEK